ncbi:MAG: hypothetical protein VX278_19115 [Myxococcota bacterium]|nr:hypothetical protein [Myxococcota bacterium]
MPIKLKLAQYTRCDIVAYSGRNFSGKKSILRIFPAGNTQGKLQVEDLASMIIRSPYGMRLILCTNTGNDWIHGTWRCINMLEEHSIPPPEKNTYPGVRIPDLDLFDAPESTRADEELISSYPIVSAVQDGSGWTFGKIAQSKLKNNVHLIIVEKIDLSDQPPASNEESMARAILEHLHQDHPDAFPSVRELLFQNLRSASEKDSLQNWIESRWDDER